LVSFRIWNYFDLHQVCEASEVDDEGFALIFLIEVRADLTLDLFLDFLFFFFFLIVITFIIFVYVVAVIIILAVVVAVIIILAVVVAVIIILAVVVAVLTVLFLVIILFVVILVIICFFLRLFFLDSVLKEALIVKFVAFCQVFLICHQMSKVVKLESSASYPT